ncbi:MAG: tRNA (N6-threonylcarbamoyladenosine(37)-N6)-methyltransferase TrmO [Candidatus Heimdallarchaeota archaeon]|nr:tRNA (N6-threonylcarbamoyladenosine(37)-N6)-methyltransferase TrmO [Candidatus Heimdallarchaeota archaeon]
METPYFKAYPIGYVKRKEENTYLEILEKYRPALLDLEKYSHLIVLWWILGNDNEKARANLRDSPPNAPVTGVFSARSPARPNPLGLTVVNILDVDYEHGLVNIRRIDAFNDSPIIDLKGYLPSSDRVEAPRVPDFFEYLPKWLPETNDP